MFKAGRMLAIAVTGETFTEKYEGMLPPLEAQAPPFATMHLQLRIRQRLAFRVYDEFDRGGITPLADGSLLVEADFPPDSWVAGYIFSFGTDVEVLEPDHLRQQLAEYAQKIADHHKT